MPYYFQVVESDTIAKETLMAALHGLNACFAKQGMTGEICLYDGAVMMLVFNARLSTQDADAIFKPPDAFRIAARSVAQKLNLKENWLNDGVKGFVSSEGQSQGLTTHDVPQFSNLRVLRPKAEYIFAMKCMAARSPGYDTEGDRHDIIFLAKHLNITNTEQALKIVEAYYPADRILPKTQFMIHEVIQELQK